MGCSSFVAQYLPKEGLRTVLKENQLILTEPRLAITADEVSEMNIIAEITEASGKIVFILMQRRDSRAKTVRGSVDASAIAVRSIHKSPRPTNSLRIKRFARSG